MGAVRINCPNCARILVQSGSLHEQYACGRCGCLVKLLMQRVNSVNSVTLELEILDTGDRKYDYRKRTAEEINGKW